MLEEVYISDTCKDLEDTDDTDIYMKNNYVGEYRNGKYYFQFPSLWFNSTCNNKSVALRSIDIKQDPPSFKIDEFAIIYETGDKTYKRVVLSGNTPYIYQNFSTTSIEEILQTLAGVVNDSISNSADEDIKNNCVCNWYYFSTERKASLHIIRSDDILKRAYLSLKLDVRYSAKSDFTEIFNTDSTFVLNNENNPYTLTFENVWNRKDCFIHASFVNGTSHNFLGKSGEFYMKPSKMYAYNGNSTEFFFEISYDGITPINKRFASFIIQLAFIYNNSDYLAE